MGQRENRQSACIDKWNNNDYRDFSKHFYRNIYADAVNKNCEREKAKDVSVLMLVILIAGICGWIYYGVLEEDLMIIISNSLSLLL